MVRFLLAIAAMLAASGIAVATNTLTLSSPPDWLGPVTLHTTGGDFVLAMPDGHAMFGGPQFGFSGYTDSEYAIVGAPRADWDGAAFLYDAATGEFRHVLSAANELESDNVRSLFGYDVLLWQGKAIVSAPLAGGVFGPGAAFVFDVETGQKLQSLWGPSNLYAMGVSLTGDNTGVYARAHNRVTGMSEFVKLNIVPEPGAMLLALLGVAAGCCRRRC
jgi:hypothetical protein